MHGSYFLGVYFLSLNFDFLILFYVHGVMKLVVVARFQQEALIDLLAASPDERKKNQNLI